MTGIQVSVDKDLLIQCCESYLVALKNEETVFVEGRIPQVMQPRPGIFGKIVDTFSPPPSSREDAIKYIRRTDGYNFAMSINQSKVQEFQQILRLLRESTMTFAVIDLEYSFLLEYKL